MTLSGETQAAAATEKNSREIEWIRLARQNDPAAWDRIVRAYEEPVFRLAYLIVGDAAEAEEVAQDAFVKAYLSLDKFDEERPLRPWLMQITRNLARNRRRSLGRYWANVRRWWQANRAETERLTPAGPRQRNNDQLLWQAVQELKPAWQEVLYLRFFLDLSEAETAKALEIVPGTVKSRQHRALAALKGVIERDFSELIE